MVSGASDEFAQTRDGMTVCTLSYPGWRWGDTERDDVQRVGVGVAVVIMDITPSASCERRLPSYSVLLCVEILLILILSHMSVCYSSSHHASSLLLEHLFTY